jgi:hypothetical protein
VYIALIDPIDDRETNHEEHASRIVAKHHSSPLMQLQEVSSKKIVSIGQDIDSASKQTKFWRSTKVRLLPLPLISTVFRAAKAHGPQNQLHLLPVLWRCLLQTPNV